jgi:pimeloyl-ACP methyl ester carboxylesterase
MAPATAMQRVKAALPNCHLTYIYEAGHGLEHDAPERVGRVVSDFLERGQAFLVPTAGDQR